VLIENNLDENIEEEEIGIACGTHGAEEKCTQRFGRGNQRK
jgi:hypothetical protein